MRKTFFYASFLIFIFSIFAAGCATTRPRQAPGADLSQQVGQMQAQLQARDQQIQDLQAQLDSYGRAVDRGLSVGKPKAVSNPMIHVPGVTPKELQTALKKAGCYSGPVDGDLGRKTKKAIKEFQKKHGLAADGVVGEKTWTLLSA